LGWVRLGLKLGWDGGCVEIGVGMAVVDEFGVGVEVGVGVGIEVGARIWVRLRLR